MKYKIGIIHQTHAGILGVGFGGIESSHPLENAFRAAPELGFGDGIQGLAAPLDLERVNTAGAARIGGRMDTDARFELIVGQLIKGGDEIQLRIPGIGHVHFILAKRHHARQGHHRMRMPALFQHLNE